MESQPHTKQPLTEGDILAAIIQLDEAGEKVTYRNIRKFLGSGSNSQIGPVYRKWMEANPPKTVAMDCPVELTNKLQEFSATIWDTAKDLARLELIQERNLIAERVADQEFAIVGMESDIEHLTQKIHEAQDAREQLLVEHRNLVAHSAQITDELSRTTEQNSALRQDLADLDILHATTTERLLEVEASLAISNNKIALLQQDVVSRAELLAEEKNTSRQLQDGLNERNTRLGQLNSELEQVSARAAELKQLAESSERELEVTRSAMARMQKQIFELEPRAARVEVLEGEARERQHQLESIRIQMAGLQQTLTAKQEESGAREAQVLQVRQRHEEALALVATKEQQNDELRIANAQLESKVTTLKEMMQQFAVTQAGDVKG